MVSSRWSVAQIADIERALGDLVQSVTRLVDAAGAGRLRDELRELREATERLALMAAAMTELELGRAPESPAGPGGGE